MLILDTKPHVGAEYSIYSVSLAMFLMLSISSSDIWTSYMLLRWGGSLFRSLFGALLLGCTALLVVASLKVLFMDATSNAELVLGTTTVLFIEDVVRNINDPKPDNPMQRGEVPKEMVSNSNGKSNLFFKSREPLDHGFKADSMRSLPIGCTLWDTRFHGAMLNISAH